MSKRAEYSLVLCSLLSLTLSCQKTSGQKSRHSNAAGRGQEMVLYSGEGFRLTLPSDIQVEKQDPAADFISYNFISRGKILLDAYVGNQPRFLFNDRAIGPERIAQLNGLPCKRAEARRKDGAVRMEVLVRFPRDRGWPTYIHFWYSNLEPENQAKAEAIIASLTPQAQGAQSSSIPDTGGPDFPAPRRSTEELIAETERRLAEMTQSPGTAEEVKKLETDLEMLKRIQRSEQEESRMSPEEREKQAWERERLGEEADKAVIADMEQGLEEMKKQQGMTKEEVEDYEAYVAKMKENYIANLERGLEEMKKQQGMTDKVKKLEAYLAKMKKEYHLEPEKKAN